MSHKQPFHITWKYPTAMSGRETSNQHTRQHCGNWRQPIPPCSHIHKGCVHCMVNTQSYKVLVDMWWTQIVWTQMRCIYPSFTSRNFHQRKMPNGWVNGQQCKARGVTHGCRVECPPASSLKRCSVVQTLACRAQSQDDFRACVCDKPINFLGSSEPGSGV